MKKIISLFQRNYDGDKLVRDEVVPGAEWVLSGEGIATRKRDGTACMVRGKLYKRYDAKKGKTPPPGFEPSQEPDEVTGHWPGWIPVSETDPGDKWHREAWEKHRPEHDGTYELCGPKVQGNPEGLQEHRFFHHGMEFLNTVPLNFTDLKAWFAQQDMEGIVWHHTDREGKMVKIKRKDFGLPWPIKREGR